jgi:HK97 gp10 family phage protein
MGNRARLRFTGLTELRHAVKSYGQNLVDASVAAVKDAVESTATQARATAPVDTGALRDSIRGSVSTDGYSVKGTVRASARHATFVEFGTEDTPKHPFLSPAAIGNQRRLNQALKAAVLAHSPDGLGTPRITGEGPATPRVLIED